MAFGRLLTAMVTPFDNDGHLCLERTTELVEHLLNNGTEGIVVAGTTGESPTLSSDEKLKLFDHVVKVVSGRAPVIAGTGSNNTQATIELTKKAEALGVDGIMIVAPYYNKPNQEGLYQHFCAVAKSTTLPIMVYNIPGRASVNIAAETTIRLAEIENIVSVKEASGDLDQMAAILANTPDDFILYSGDDGLALPVMAIGGYGIVSVAAHVIGKDMSKMIEHFINGDMNHASVLHQRMLPVMRELFASPSPVPVKTVLNNMGIAVGGVRLPMIDLTEEQSESLSKVLTEYGINV